MNRQALEKAMADGVHCAYAAYPERGALERTQRAQEIEVLELGVRRTPRSTPEVRIRIVETGDERLVGARKIIAPYAEWKAARDAHVEKQDAAKAKVEAARARAEAVSRRLPGSFVRQGGGFYVGLNVEEAEALADRLEALGDNNKTKEK